ncbi:asparagine synthase-related protein [Streptomyces hainanensis]
MAPYPLDVAGVWRGVESVQPGEALHLGADGSVRTERWWQPPPSDLPLAEAAPLLRDALGAAIAARVRPGQIWGADLSGGMDSTSLCFLAHEAGAELVAVTLEWAALTNEDAHYARQAARHLPGITHLTFPSGTLPGHFAHLDESHPPLDDPNVLLRDRAQQEHMVRALREHGALRRLSGHGGDHLVAPQPAYLHRLVRRHPVAGARHAAAHRAAGRWPLATMLRQLSSRRSLTEWLAAQADSLAATRRGQQRNCDWGPPLALPSWATSTARGLAAEAFRQAADSSLEAFGPDRGTHAWVHMARLAGVTSALLDEWSQGVRLPFEAPFCDDGVLTACLRVRPQEAGHPAAYKPLLKAAMHGVVPEEILARTTKDDSSQEWYAGLTAQRRTFAAWAADFHLGALGLIDPAALRRSMLAPSLVAGGAPELEYSLGIEKWLRELDIHPDPSHLKDHPRDRHASTSAPSSDA